MRKTCVKHAYNQRQTCGRLSTASAVLRQTARHRVDNRHVVHDMVHSQSTTFSTGIALLPPLFEHNIYPVSTAPIITNHWIKIRKGL